LEFEIWILEVSILPQIPRCAPGVEVDISDMRSTVSEIRIPAGSVTLDGELSLPHDARGVVLFAHGSGSSRHSPRNQFVANVLQESGHGTLLFDLLTKQEEAAEAETGHLRFNIALLAERLVHATEALETDIEAAKLDVGFFGSSTGGGAALVAAARLGEDVRAVVSRGGRPDLAGADLRLVNAPTLLIVGGDDEDVIALNEEAMRALACEKRLMIVPGAGHLFEEPGTLEQVANAAAEWFTRHFSDDNL
jgi:putative phosphoribosyl transferase